MGSMGKASAAAAMRNANSSAAAAVQTNRMKPRAEGESQGQPDAIPIRTYDEVLRGKRTNFDIVKEICMGALADSPNSLLFSGVAGFFVNQRRNHPMFETYSNTQLASPFLAVVTC